MEDFQLLGKITLSGCAEKVKIKVKQMGLKQKQYVFSVLLYENKYFASVSDNINQQFIYFLRLMEACMFYLVAFYREQFAVCEFHLTSVKPGISN